MQPKYGYILGVLLCTSTFASSNQRAGHVVCPERACSEHVYSGRAVSVQVLDTAQPAAAAEDSEYTTGSLIKYLYI